MPDHRKIYAQQAEQYESFVIHEDYQRNILPTLQSIAQFEGASLVELGAGTGRLTRMLAPLVNTVRAFDHSEDMLQVAHSKLPLTENWQLAVADHRHIPVHSHTADIIVSGWSYCYLAISHKETWEQELAKGLVEINRVLRPGGTFIILDTLGTGHKTPFVYEGLVDYFATLENEGFQKTWIRTDYHFKSIEEAGSYIGFFFGDDLAQKVIDNHWVIVPECTGVWWKKW